MIWDKFPSSSVFGRTFPVIKGLSSWMHRGKNGLKALSARINDLPFRSLGWFYSVWGVKSATGDFWRGSPLVCTNGCCLILRWFCINSLPRWDNPSRDAAAIKREPKQYNRRERQEIWVLLKMCAGSCQGNSVFCFSLELNRYCPTLCRFFVCVHVFERASRPACVCVWVWMCAQREKEGVREQIELVRKQAWGLIWSV